MVEHTPGPWEASERGDYSDLDGNSRVILGDDRRIAIVLHHGSAEDEANTRLIVQSVNAFAALAEHLGCKPEDLNVNLVKWHGIITTLAEAPQGSVALEIATTAARQAPPRHR